jgi:hypothetical protein
MSRIVILSYLVIVCVFLSPFRVNAAIESSANNNPFAKSSSKFLLNVEKDQPTVSIDRKLSFKEKIALKVLKRKLKKASKVKKSDAADQTQMDGLAIAGFVTGLVGLFVFGIILGAIAVVFSAIALKRIKREPEKRSGRGLAIAGLVLGIVGVVGALVVLAFIA